MILTAGVINGLKEIRAHKMRSMLTMFGIVLGVAALVAMIGIIQGMMNGWKSWIVESGGLEKMSTDPREPPEEQQAIVGQSPGRTLADAEAILKACPLVDVVSPEVHLPRAQLQAGRTVYRAERVTGCWDAFLRMNNYELEEGRGFVPLDEERCAQVVVLGSEPARELFGEGARAVGRWIRLAGLPFQVVGVLQHYETQQMSRRRAARYNPLAWKNRAVLIPLATMRQRLTGVNQLSELDIKARSVDQLDDLAEQLENTILLTHRGIRDYQITTREEMLSQFSQFESTFMVSLGGVAGISLLIGGIGIMNVMLATITERIREIGIRKAVGARDRDIFFQFLAESVTLSTVGGVLGLLASVGLISLLKIALAELTEPALSFNALVVGFSFSVGVGIVFGLYPAIRASRLDPIDALRYE